MTRSTNAALVADSQWFVAVINPNCHRRAVNELSELGYRTFFPTMKKWVSHARVRKSVDRPILGRYLFVEVDPAMPERLRAGRGFGFQSFHSVRCVNGVEGLVGVCGAPVAVPIGTVEDLLHRQMSGEWNFVDQGPMPDGKGGIRFNENLPVGARVKIVEGQFEGWTATITKRKGRVVDFKFAGENRYGRMNDVSVRAA